jgi:hypothetical protein
MVAPEYRGRVSARQAFQHVLRLQQEFFRNHADYFYGEARTETAKFHAIFDELGWRPWAVLPRKDVFFGRRESEVIYVKYFGEPLVGTLDLTPAAARVASAVLGRRILPAVNVDKLPPLPRTPTRGINEYAVHSPGDAAITVSVPGAVVTADACPASREVEHVVVRARDDTGYGVAVRAFVAYLRVLGMEYAEIYVPARSGIRQAMLESLGFQPTGLLPAWHAPGLARPATCLAYTISFPSSLPDCPLAFTKNGEFLRSFVTPCSVAGGFANAEAPVAATVTALERGNAA